MTLRAFLLLIAALPATTLALPVRALKPHVQYLRYVARHKWFVFQAGRVLRVQILRLILHDWTKFLPREWFPYVRFFYTGKPSLKSSGGTIAKRATPEFEAAWNHHMHKNDHHWQFWVRIGDDGSELVLPMPDQARREMLADWRGAGRALGKPDTAAWYKTNRDNMKLHEDTREWIEKQLGLLD